MGSWNSNQYSQVLNKLIKKDSKYNFFLAPNDFSLIIHYLPGSIKIIDKISEQNKDEINWWLSSAATKNTFNSDLFHIIVLKKAILRLDKEKTSKYNPSKKLKYKKLS